MFYIAVQCRLIASGRRRLRLGLNLPVATDRYRPEAATATSFLAD